MTLDAEELKAQALGLGFQAVGVCEAKAPQHLDAYRAWLEKGYHGDMAYLARHLELKADPNSLLPGVASIVAVAMNYNRPPRKAGDLRIARYALGRDYHRVMRSKLRRLEAWMQAAVPSCRTRLCVDSAPLLERDFAQRAGLGFYGKNTMLIDPKRGSWFFLGFVLSTAIIAPDRPAPGTCGTCARCIDACPTGAIVFEENRWQIDARRCISYLTIEHRGAYDASLEAKVGDWAFGCDVCQEVCPFNQSRPSQPLRGAFTAESAFSEDRELPTPETVSEHEWDRLTRGSAMRRTGYAGWVRNARIAKANLARRD